MYLSEDNVNRSIVAPAFFPPVDNPLVVTVYCEQHAGAVKSEQGTNKELKGNVFWPT